MFDDGHRCPHLAGHDWQGKENLQGASCAIGEWNDREVNVGSTAMTVGG